MSQSISEGVPPTPKGLRRDPRELVADRARQRLERQVDVWLAEEAGGLTAAEFVAVVTSVFADTLSSWARHEIRSERDVEDDRQGRGSRGGR
ncbi:hypothetical protein FHX74_000143 [Friedmanniella endophytica]|uniref:Uncharacterized protein n=1 Tax=Microlunatus kandeliicorticis TaxID=1759536 RepID=A0A7W3INX4_9ACTN|nr:hypothetical protein [Microlunatus kandeliicorticis]MBA8792549.1 hypothetical protein [Microlunatus kandeliicorticis]